MQTPTGRAGGAGAPRTSSRPPRLNVKSVVSSTYAVKVPVDQPDAAQRNAAAEFLRLVVQLCRQSARVAQAAQLDAESGLEIVEDGVPGPAKRPRLELGEQGADAGSCEHETGRETSERERAGKRDACSSSQSARRRTKRVERRKLTKMKPHGFVFGLNEVVRACERKEMAVVVIRFESTPHVVLTHILGLAYVYGVALLFMPEDSSIEYHEVSVLLARTQCFGIQREQLHEYTEFFPSIQAAMLQLDFNWLARRDRMPEKLSAKH
ncbi:hypothetical protein FVE85_3932 [Porphyridium purpureum]|uniref:Uncharacterized protein n=1 Tax=Porphyridium purpureum TaxID=35688 RepID=A0A5J4YU65_PORPP|nr:hypothetical protein FVE85_3932 [Porphyridium purpureum]|eukprot:POR3647..scf229_5